MRNFGKVARNIGLGMISAVACATLAHAEAMQDDAVAAKNKSNLPLPTGQFVTPTAPPNAVQQFLNPGLPNYPNFVANEAVRSQLSPDGSTLLILCAGYNNNLDKTGANDLAASNQYIFVYNVAGPNKKKPLLAQVIQQTNSYVGLVWAPDGKTFYASGGVDDAVYAYARTGGVWTQAAKIALGHNGAGLGLGVKPNAAGLAISSDGKTLVVANNYNDSISVIDTASCKVRYEHDLRPFNAANEGADGVAGGEFPVAVAIKGGGTVYVSANRDREIVVVNIASLTSGHLIKRIKVDGLPNGMTLNAAQTKLYVAQDNADQVAVIDTKTNAIVAKIDTRAPAGLLRTSVDEGKRDSEGRSRPRYTGAAPFAVTISPDQKTLYAVNDGANSIAVISLAGDNANSVKGLIPTAYAPKDITLSADGSWMYIINGKSDQGPNPLNLTGDTAQLTSITYPGGNAAAAVAAAASNQYELNNNRSTLVSASVPTEDALETLTRQVARNNFYSIEKNEYDERTMGFLKSKIKHVIYIIKKTGPSIRCSATSPTAPMATRILRCLARPSRRISITSRAISSPSTTSSTPATPAWTAGVGRCKAAPPARCR